MLTVQVWGVCTDFVHYISDIKTKKSNIQIDIFLDRQWGIRKPAQAIRRCRFSRKKQMGRRTLKNILTLKMFFSKRLRDKSFLLILIAGKNTKNAQSYAMFNLYRKSARSFYHTILGMQSKVSGPRRSFRRPASPSLPPPCPIKNWRNSQSRHARSVSASTSGSRGACYSTVPKMRSPASPRPGRM